MLTMKQKQAITATIVRRYAKAHKKEKTKILDEFVAITLYNRSYARRVLNQSKGRDFRKKKPKRVVVNKKYDLDFLEQLKKLWAIQNFICGKRLKPFIPELIRVLERDNELKITDEVKAKLQTVSAATIDRLLAPTKKSLSFKGISGTKPGALLKSQIPLRTFADWDELQPGFFEMDTVAFCGERLTGHHVWGLNFTDVATGWVGLDAVMGKGQHGIHQASKDLKTRLAFSMLGLDSDNGSEFINGIMLRLCQENKITFTRIRPGRKNDNCFVEQKNYTVLRTFLGYQRYDTNEQLQLIKKLLRVVEYYVNFFQPSRKLVNKIRIGAKVKKIYDQAQTPYQRLLKFGILTKQNQNQLYALYESLNPVQLLTEMTKLHKQLKLTNRYNLDEAAKNTSVT